MIYREPIPLLEAFHFFRAQKFGFSLKDYLDNLIKRHPTHEKEYDEYFVHLFAVYEALAGATVDDEMTDVLFGPLSTKGRRASNRGRGDCIAELLIEEVSVFCREDPFAVIRGRPENVLWQRIAAAVCGDAEEDKLDNGDAEDLGCYNTVESVLRMINGSKLSRRSKLDLIDLTLTRDKYIDAFEAALTSAARTFSENRALWLPLISVFADSYSNEGGEEKILDELLHFSDERVKDIVIYPSVVSFSSYYIDVDAESGLCSVDLLNDRRFVLEIAVRRAADTQLRVGLLHILGRLLRDAGLSAQKIQSAARLLEHAEQVRGKIDARDLFLQRRFENLRPQHDARAVRQDERGLVQDRAERLVMQGLIGHFGIRRHTVRGLGPLQQRPRRIERLRHGHIIILYAQNIRLHAHTSSIIVFVSFILPYLPALVYSRRAVRRAHFFPPRILWGKSGPARLYSAFN